VLGFLNSQSPETSVFSEPLRGFRQGLRDSGYTEGSNVAVDYRWANNQLDLLPALADALVRRKVAVIVATGGLASALAAKAATSNIPIVFNIGSDPVKVGLVASLPRPGGNLTGVHWFTVDLGAKRLALLRELVPSAGRIAVLVNPANRIAESTLNGVEVAARANGLQIQVLKASSSTEIDAAFAILGHDRPDGLIVGPGPPFTNRHIQLIQLAMYYRVPAIYAIRQSAEIGGLMSYGTSLTDAYRQVGVYAGRILKGAKPADLPVMRSTKFELVINAQTARILGLTVPPTLLAIADKVIE
jgi:putative ABC transport system substrate-binding protein